MTTPSAADHVVVDLSPEFLEIDAQVRSTPAFGATTFDFEGLRQGMGTRREPTVPGIVVKPVTIGDMTADWVYDPAQPSTNRLLYLHGGGYVSGSSGFYLPMAASMARITGCALLLPNYRLGPEHPCPAAVEDAVAAFQWIQDNGPTAATPASVTFIAGDSAGGGLTLATLIALRDGICGAVATGPKPAAAIPISAYADLAHTGESIRTREAADPIMSPRCLPDFASRYVGDGDLRHPLASPLYADLHDLPPLLMQVGDCEIILDDTVRVAAKARAAGVDVTVEIWDNMFHVWQSHVPQFPEGQLAIEHMARFLKPFMA